MSQLINDLKRQYRTSTITLKLIVLNVSISLLFFILGVLSPSIYNLLFPWLTLSSDIHDSLFKPWTLLTYTVIHAGIVHLIFNMLLLHFIGNLFLNYFSEKKFLIVYIIGGISGGIFFLVGSSIVNFNSTLIGSSSAVLAPLFFIVTYRPKMTIHLALIGEVKLWHIAVLISILEIIQLSGGNIGGHFAHFGGALGGVLYFYISREKIKITSLFKFRSKKKIPLKVVKNNAIRKESNPAAKDRRIDDILKKISQSGYESLTKEEKSYLFTAGKKS